MSEVNVWIRYIKDETAANSTADPDDCIVNRPVKVGSFGVLVNDLKAGSVFLSEGKDNWGRFLWKELVGEGDEALVIEDARLLVVKAARGEDGAPAAKRQRAGEPASEDGDNFSIKAPSSCDDADFDSHQKQGHFLNFRPAQNAPKQPAALVHPCLGEFQDTFHNQKLMLQAKHYRLAVRFCNAMCENFSSEADRQAVVQTTLEELTDAVVRSSTQDPCIHGFCNKQGLAPDLLIADEVENQDPVYAILLSKVQQEIGGTCVPADRQGMIYYRFFWKDRNEKPVRQNSACPGLLLVVVGNIFSVYAVFYGSRVSMIPLTPFLHAISLRRYDQRQMDSVVRCFMALDKAVKDIRAYMSLLNKMGGRAVPATYYSQIAESVWKGGQPEPGCIPREIVRKDLPLRLSNPCFEVQRIPGYESKHVYVVKLEPKAGRELGQEQRVFKYTQSYSRPVHETLSDLGLAPKLICFVPLPGQWIEVQMEHLRREQGWRTLEDLKPSDKERLKKTVLDALSRVHAAGGENKIVLGDCRSVNVMVRGFDGQMCGEEVRFLDFDFSGYENSAKYPAHLNFRDISWPQGVAAGACIRQDHDVALLSKTVRW